MTAQVESWRLDGRVALITGAQRGIAIEFYIEMLTAYQNARRV
jgi:NAD(P)-dependent dehydrogenase (short-subunit alcohol dehydrogenase family)